MDHSRSRSRRPLQCTSRRRLQAKPCQAFNQPASHGNALPIIFPFPSPLTIFQFDDLTPGQPIPVPYKGLNYLSGDIESDVQPYGNHKIIIAQSEPNYLGAAASNGASYGVAIDGTTTTSFDLGSFYFACIDGRSQEALGCQIFVSGIEVGGELHQDTLLTYTPAFNSDFSAPMQQFYFGWEGLSSFDVKVVADNATLERLYTYTDNVQYTTYP